MHVVKKIAVLGVLLVGLLMIVWVTVSQADSRPEPRVGANHPILVGPPGTRFWTTYANARNLFGAPVVRCRTTHCDHRIGTAQDSYYNRYMSAEKPGDTLDLQLVAKADNSYQTADGHQLLFHQWPVARAPWISKNHQKYYMKRADGTIVTIGHIDSSYRQIGSRRGLMTKGAAVKENWTGDADGAIYRLHDNKMYVVGEYDRRWVTIQDTQERLKLPLMMSRSTINGSPWIGEFGGVIYVDVCR